MSSTPSTAHDPGDDLVSVADAARELGTDHTFLRRRIKDGRLPAVQLHGSRLIRIRRADLDALKTPIGETSTDAWVEKLLAQAPPLSDEQRNRLAELLRPARREIAGGAGQ